MLTHWVFNGCENGLREQFQEYWGKKEPRLERYLKSYPDGPHATLARDALHR